MTMSSELIWGEYDEQADDVPEVGIERYNPITFKRKYSVFRFSHLANKIVSLDTRTELPTGSVLHLLDDATRTEHSDLPEVDHPFLTRESFRKYIYHVRTPVLKPIMLDDKFIYREAGLPTILLNFRTEQANNFKYCNTLEDIPQKNEALIVVNHNPIFRAKFHGQLQYFRKVQLVLTSIFNVVHQLNQLPQKKQQYILIPWDEQIFKISEFIPSRTKLDINSIKHPDSWHYIVMMHLVNFMWEDATTSLLSKLPEEDLSYITLVLQLKDKYLFYNLQDLKNMSDHNRAYPRLVNQLNMLSLTGRVAASTTDDVKEQISEYIETRVVDPKQEDTTATHILKKTDTSDASVEEEEKVASTIDRLAKLTPVTTPTKIVQGVKDRLERITSTPEPKSISPAKTKTDPQQIKEVSVRTSDLEAQPKQDVKDYAQSWLQDVDDAAIEVIQNTDFLTPAQKRRATVLAQKYKNLELNGRKLSSILTQDTDVSMDEDDIDPSILGLGDIPDPSSLKSSLRAYDRAYMEKTFTRHLVGAVTSFQRQGVFLVDIKANKVVSELNNYTEYNLKYEDLEGKQSTIKFRIPTVDRNGRIKVDGISKVLKKQRVTLPIVKINETEVSLSSNYNKTRVIRNTTSSHNYFTFIDNILQVAKGKVHITYGTCTLHDFPIAYEYAVLAERYREIYFRDSIDEVFSLYFDYPSRLEHFKQYKGLEQDLTKLEENYGVYCGSSSKQWYFIDNFNHLSAIRHQGGEVLENPYTSLLDIIRLAPGEDYKPKQLAEYVTIKILDANLPIIFMLAYRFGLRAILDYMGVKYTITENRSKVIIGEAAAEDITDVEVKYKPKSGDIGIKFLDKTLWFNRYPLKNSLIVAGLSVYDLSAYEMSEFESKDIYYQLLLDKSMSINYLKGIDSFYDLFVDNMTYDILKSMGEPTTVRDLLIRATEMLTTLDHRVPSARVNHRIRGYEQFVATFYNEMSRQFAAYKSRRGKNNKFSVNPEAIYLRMVQNAALVPSESPNPLQDIKEQSYLTYAGIGGRTGESFVVEDRRYSADDVGVISEATVDNGKVGMNAQLSFDPAITNTEGILGESQNPQPANVFSIYPLVFPFATHDDKQFVLLRSNP